MKIWLDDQCHNPEYPDRHAPEGWIGISDPVTAINFLSKAEEISFDHDLAYIEAETGIEVTGYSIAKVIEMLAYEGKINRIKWSIHSSNPTGRKNIEAAMKSAERFWDGKE